jgi:hypothetical protein
MNSKHSVLRVHEKHSPQRKSIPVILLQHVTRTFTHAVGPVPDQCF